MSITSIVYGGIFFLSGLMTELGEAAQKKIAVILGKTDK